MVVLTLLALVLDIEKPHGMQLPYSLPLARDDEAFIHVHVSIHLPYMYRTLLADSILYVSERHMLYIHTCCTHMLYIHVIHTCCIHML